MDLEVKMGFERVGYCGRIVCFFSRYYMFIFVINNIFFLGLGWGWGGGSDDFLELKEFGFFWGRKRVWDLGLSCFFGKSSLGVLKGGREINGSWDEIWFEFVSFFVFEK